MSIKADWDMNVDLNRLKKAVEDKPYQFYKRETAPLDPSPIKARKLETLKEIDRKHLDIEEQLIKFSNMKLQKKQLGSV